MRLEYYDLHGRGGHEYEVYDMPPKGESWWDSVTNVPCPVPGCNQTVVWYEAGYVPGYRVCVRPVSISDDRMYDELTIRHRFLAGAAFDHETSTPTLIRDTCCETMEEE